MFDGQAADGSIPMTFEDLGLSETVLRAVADSGYTVPTPIQAQAIPYVLMGRDVLGCAQTGTGKTAGFTLPMIDILNAGRAKARMPRSLILEPTRELAAQVAGTFDRYGKYARLTKALLIGGESMADQVKVLERGVDVLIATPGRLLDVFERGYLVMNDVRILVIDEADRMLDMGFIPDVERIVSLVSRARQTLFFSATMPAEIRRLSEKFLNNPKAVTVAPPSTPAETVAQGLVVLPGGGTSIGIQKAKRAALRALIDTYGCANGLIFCNRKRDVGVVQRSLVRHGYDAVMMHGDMVQSARTDVLSRFRRGEARFMVCSDVAARGLDIVGVEFVFNFDVPSNAEDYVHRIGRTGRAGRSGTALTIAVAEDGRNVQAVEQLIGGPIPRINVEGIETGELDTGGRKGRGKRRRGKATESRSSASEAPAAPPKAANPTPPPRQPGSEQPAPKPPPAAPARAPAPRSRQRREDADPPVVGMGDHVPAFLLRQPKLSGKVDA